MLELLSVAGHPVPVAALWRVDVLAGLMVDEALAALEAEGTVRCDDTAMVTVEPDTAASVSARLGGINRSRLRSSLGAALPLGGPVPDAAVAGHRLAGAAVRPHLDMDLLGWAEGVAEALVERGALEDAADVYAGIIGVCDRIPGADATAPDRAQAVTARVRLASLRRGAGATEEATELLTEAIRRARRSQDPRLLGRTCLSVSAHDVAVDDQPSVVAPVDEALARLGDADDVLRAQLLAHRVHRCLFSDLDAARRDADDALALARTTGDADAIAAAAHARRIAIWHPSTHDESLALADEIVAAGPVSAEHTHFADGTRLHVFAELGDFTRFDRELDRYEQAAHRHRRAIPTLWSESARGLRASVRGDWGVALEHSKRAMALGNGPDLQASYQAQLCFQLSVAWQRGDSLAGLYERAQLPVGPLALAWERTLAGWTAHARTTADVADVVERALGRGASGVRPDVTWGVTMASLAMAVVELAGRPAPEAASTGSTPRDGSTAREMAISDEGRRRMRRHALTLIAAIEPYADQWAGMGVTVTNGPFALHLGRLARVVGEHERARHLLGTAVGATRRAEATAWLSRGLLALAEVPTVATDGRCRSAREALELAVELRQAGVARDARAVLAALGEVALPAGLTRREGEVLAQVALGATNREVADRLFVSVKTVERHLLNAYSKLGVRTRTEAAAWVLRHGLAAAPEPERG